ncbi:trypsin-like serine peptidase [Litoreibacter janthinus]|uniref:V8-like Glu-specific endopeptidase n=1 Tax=Litoreibacter janthinus TaxID=670154 RepID=A0A1I6FSQ8_9RHOB|nr:trypsin-like peptidase domain-containing protein [Litoreibacter janthinus]SFR32837.1 V8-like Glu-specific endopeptidase [Litoreibacter janthinus]
MNDIGIHTQEDAFIRHSTRQAPILTTPKPGSFYRIQFGKGGLMTTTGKAYGVSGGAERLRLAQRICNHPVNRDLLVAPKNAYERKYFSGGIISFAKRFTSTVPQRRALRGEKKSFAVVWIPSQSVSGPFDMTFSTHKFAGRRTASGAAKQLVRKLDTGRICKRRFYPNLLIGEDDRIRVSDRMRTRTPYRWVCKIISIFPRQSTGNWPIGHGSGVLLTGNRMATNAHVISSDFGTASALIVIPGFSKADPPDVTRLDDDAAPFGVWLIPRHHGGVANFHLPSEYRGLGDMTADFAAVDFNGAKHIGGKKVKSLDGWTSVSRNLALTAPQAANPAGQDATISSDPTHTRRLLRTVGQERVFAAGYPADRLGEMMQAVDRVRPLDFALNWVSGGRSQSANDYPDFMNRALIGSRLDTMPGNSGGPAWIERTISRRGGAKTVKRKQYILAGLVRSGSEPIKERIEFEKSSSTNIVFAPSPSAIEAPVHTGSQFVALTPFVLERLLTPSMMLPA